MGDPPGPLCASKLGVDWIDDGTLCLSRSGSGGPLGMLASLLAGAVVGIAGKTQYDNDHLYSTAPEAITKRAIDLKIIGNDYSRGGEVRIDNEQYLKSLIEIGSGGKQKVGGAGAKKKLQFFIIRGGGEGFLPDWLKGKDASNTDVPGSTTSGASATFWFDENDLLAVFDGTGKLINSARLRRPLFIPGDDPKKPKWRRKTAATVYNSWADKDVFIYRNTTPGWIPYLGLGVDDGMRGKVGTVDMHKEEATNGCIFIVDPTTPEMDDPDPNKLGKFEPKLIQDISRPWDAWKPTRRAGSTSAKCTWSTSSEMNDCGRRPSCARTSCLHALRNPVFREQPVDLSVDWLAGSAR